MVETAVILAAGLGTRFAPLSRFIPKELLPLGRVPILGWLVEEMVCAGVSRIILVSSPSKSPLARYFRFLVESRGFEAIVVHQREPKGTGHALLRARRYVGRAPFLVYYADELWLGEPSRAQQLQKAYGEVGGMICAVSRADDPQILSRFGVVEIGREERPGLYTITRVVEKPKPEEAPSDLGLISGMLLEPLIFEAIEEIVQQAPREGEVFLTEALDLLCQVTILYALELEGEWVDAGTLERYPYAFVRAALADPEIGEEFREYLAGAIRSRRT